MLKTTVKQTDENTKYIYHPNQGNDWTEDENLTNKRERK